MEQSAVLKIFMPRSAERNALQNAEERSGAHSGKNPAVPLTKGEHSTYLEIGIRQLILKFAPYPQYSFAVINHFSYTSSPVIIKKTAVWSRVYFREIPGNSGKFREIPG